MKIAIALIAIALIACVLLTSCGGVSIENTRYRIKQRTLNIDDTYTYLFNDSSYFQSRDKLTTKQRFKVGDTFTFKIIKGKTR